MLCGIQNKNVWRFGYCWFGGHGVGAVFPHQSHHLCHMDVLDKASSDISRVCHGVDGLVCRLMMRSSLSCCGRCLNCCVHASSTSTVNTLLQPSEHLSNRTLQWQCSVCPSLCTAVTVMILIWYYTIEQFNVDSKAECDQLNLAHVARNII